MVSGGVAEISEPSRPAGITITPRRSASHASPARARSRPGAVPAGRLEALAGGLDAAEQPGHLVEHDERGRARERVAHVRVRVDVLRARAPTRARARAGRAPPRSAGRGRAPCRSRARRRGRPSTTSTRSGRGRSRSRRRSAARPPRRSARRSDPEEAGRRDAGAGAALDGLDDHAAGVGAAAAPDPAPNG